MSEEAAAAVTTEAATEPAAPVKDIKTAQEVIDKVLKAPPKPGEKPDPKRRVEKLEEASAAAPEAEPEPAAGAAVSEKARYYLQHGDIAKAIDTAFGDLKSIDASLPDGVREALARKLGVNSKQWEQVRKFEAQAKRTVAAKEQELATVISRLKAEYGPLHQARQAYEAGDYDAAFKSAFGEDAADFQRKVISQRVGKDPQVEKLRAELEAERAETRRQREQEQQARAEAEEAQQVQAYVSKLGRDLADSDDADIRRFASRPPYVNRVFQILRENYDADTNTTIPFTVAAEAARDEILATLRQWGQDDTETGAAPANAARASALPAKPPGKPVRALKQSQAAEASGQPQKLTSEQVRAKYQRAMEAITD